MSSPDLPKARYKVWVRGYGLIDSPKVDGLPGPAPEPQSRAGADASGGGALLSRDLLVLDAENSRQEPIPWHRRPRATGSQKRAKNQFVWLNDLKSNGCVGCHQLGNEATRTISKALGQFKTSADAWLRRIQSGQASKTMVRDISWFGPQKIAGLLGDWTDRVKPGRTALVKASATARRGTQCRRDDSGTGARPKPICMTRSRPISASRRSMPMADSTARRS